MSSVVQHCAQIYRKEEGYVLVNAHPAYDNPHAIAGMINEPRKNEAANMLMVNAYAELLQDNDPQLKSLGVRQPLNAAAAWSKHILNPKCTTGDARRAASRGLSERMVLYMSTAYTTRLTRS